MTETEARAYLAAIGYEIGVEGATTAKGSKFRPMAAEIKAATRVIFEAECARNAGSAAKNAANEAAAVEQRIRDTIAAAKSGKAKS